MMSFVRFQLPILGLGLVIATGCSLKTRRGPASGADPIRISRGPASAADPAAITPKNCNAIFQEAATPIHVNVVKVKKDGSKIYRLDYSSGKTLYLKEDNKGQDYTRSVFDDVQMSATIYSAAESFGLGDFVAAARPFPKTTFSADGNTVHTRAGIVQEGGPDLVSPVDEFKARHPDREPTVQDIQKILNKGEWPRLYANWKIFWTIFGQTDLNIANLSRQGKNLYIFDLGDAMNFTSVRQRFGIENEKQNFDFNMPDRADLRTAQIPDFRLADPAFKQMVKTIVNEDPAALAARFGKKLTDQLPPPRGSMEEHIKELKWRAQFIAYRLDKSPFDP